MIPALPSIQHSLHATETGVTWLLTGYLLSASVGTAIIGRLGDMYGKERLLLDAGLLAAGTLLAALSTSLAMMIVGARDPGRRRRDLPAGVRDRPRRVPREKVAGSIGMLSSILGDRRRRSGSSLGGADRRALDWQWLFWMPLMVIVLSAAAAPGGSCRSRRSGRRGKVNWLAAALMSIGMTCVADRGHGDDRVGLGVAADDRPARRRASRSARLWVVVEIRSGEPLIDMAMMRIRGVWTTNLAAFLLGGGMYATFIVFPQFAQLPRRAPGSGSAPRSSIAGLYLLPCGARDEHARAPSPGPVARRFGSRAARNRRVAIAAAGVRVTRGRARPPVRHADHARR